MPLAKIPLQGGPQSGSDYVLLRVQDDGTEDLDLKLTATDQFEVFAIKITTAHIGSLQSSKRGGSNDDPKLWQAALSYVLLCHRPEQRYQAIVDNLDTFCVVNKDGMTITIRHKISGITQRLGELLLKRTSAEIELFEWAGEEAQLRAESMHRVTKLEEESASQQGTIATLQSQLEEFVKVKRIEEEKMLEQFRQLLNTKKLKIRDQQRLLAGAKIDSNVAKQIQTARKHDARSVPRKRKGSPPADEEEEVDEGKMSQSDDEDRLISGSPEHSDQSADESDGTEEPAKADEAGENEDSDDEL